jgi:hypothetical protein
LLFEIIQKLLLNFVMKLAEHIVTDTQGNRIAAVLDIKTYDRLREAAEELADIRAFDSALPKVRAELKSGKFDSLSAYIAKRSSKRK